MATYYTSTNNQREAARMLYLREPMPSSYPEASVLPGNMMVYMNSGSYTNALAGNSLQQNNCIEISSVGGLDSTPHQQEIFSNLSASRIGENDLNVWRDDRNEMLVMHPMGGTTNNLQGQGLSLSLGTQIPSGIQMPPIPCQNSNPGFVSFMSPNPPISGEGGSRNGASRDGHFRNAENMPLGFPGGYQDSNKRDWSSYGMSSVARTIPNSKYLKAAQLLLDEVVNVRQAMKQADTEKNQGTHEHQMKNSEGDGGSKNEAENAQESARTPPNELSHADRQELQNKLTKLLSMLDEVDRRYKQYYHQMQIVVSSFDVIAGSGAAKPYTALALQTISRHFRCLRDAISGQIQATRKSLGEQDTSGNSKGVGITRLRYVDQQLKQQRALQQLGMMQQHTWRPQRGLPESSVSILRAWLFEHFLHPYPKDSDKIMLARQTGLTRSQVSNWFINARVRLWKPMVEEMYKEEIGDAEMDSNSSSDNAVKGIKSQIRTSEERGEDLQQSASSTATERCSSGQFMDSKSDDVPHMDMLRSTGGASFQNRTQGETETEYGIMKLSGEQRPGVDNCSLYPDAIVQSEGGSVRFMAASEAAYHISELGRFGSGNGVSLTLGLQQHPMSGGMHHSFFTTRGDDVYNAASSSVGHETTDFECVDPDGSRQHRFNSSHLLHDFVA